MGCYQCQRIETVHAYKHIETRRYQYLDEAGHAYRLGPGGVMMQFVPHRSPMSAWSELDGPILAPASTSAAAQLAAWEEMRSGPAIRLDGIA
jgi:hypothetical protein